MIEIDQVSKRFGRVEALRDVSLRLEVGERVAFVGANGSGKSTLLRAVLGLIRVTGQVRIAGIDVARDPQRALARVAYVPQVAPPLDAPVSEVVRAYATLRAMPVPAIHACAGNLGLDLAAVAKVRCRDLSSGMKQKLLAALALCTDADVLICDEPTASLDGDARNAFFDELEARWAKQLVILCTHRSEDLHRFVARRIEFKDGRVLRDHRPECRSQPVMEMLG